MEATFNASTYSPIHEIPLTTFGDTEHGLESENTGAPTSCPPAPQYQWLLISQQLPLSVAPLAVAPSNSHSLALNDMELYTNQDQLLHNETQNHPPPVISRSPSGDPSIEQQQTQLTTWAAPPSLTDDLSWSHQTSICSAVTERSLSPTLLGRQSLITRPSSPLPGLYPAEYMGEIELSTLHGVADFQPDLSSLLGIQRCPSQSSKSADVASELVQYSVATTNVETELQLSFAYPPAVPSHPIQEQSRLNPYVACDFKPAISDCGEKQKMSENSGRAHMRARQRVYCDICNTHPDGFRGDHELRRHIESKHSEKIKIWICRDPGPQGGIQPETPLSCCKTCRAGKTYGKDYNAAAHLRRCHFNAKRVRKGSRRKVVISGKDNNELAPTDNMEECEKTPVESRPLTLDWPSLSDLKRFGWLEKLEVQCGADFSLTDINHSLLSETAEDLPHCHPGTLDKPLSVSDTPKSGDPRKATDTISPQTNLEPTFFGALDRSPNIMFPPFPFDADERH